MRQHYVDYPQDFKSLKKELTEFLEMKKQGASLTLRLPAKDGTFEWNQFSMFFNWQNIGGIPIVYAIGNEINDVIRNRENKVSLHDEKIRELIAKPIDLEHLIDILQNWMK